MSDRSQTALQNTEDLLRGPGSVLLVARDAAIEVLLRECARRMERPVTAAVARDGDEALARLEEVLFDCVVVDQTGKEDDDLGDVAAILGFRPEVPVVLILDETRSDLIARALQAGVCDVLFAGNLEHDVIQAVIERNLERHRRAVEFRSVRRELEDRRRDLEEKDRILSARVQELLEIQSQSLFRGYEVDRLNRMLESLRGIAEAMAEDPGSDPPFLGIVERIVAAVDVEFGLLYRAGDDGWTLEAAAGYPEQAVEWFRGRNPEEVFPAEDIRVIRRRESDVEGGLVEAERALAIRSRLVCPVSAHDRKLGVLVLAATGYERFCQTEVAIVRACEHHLILALSSRGSLFDGNAS